MSQIAETAAALEPDVIQWRRHLHANPELGFEEHETARFIVDKLTSFGIDVQRPTETGVVGIIKGGSGPTAAIRADIDALPIQEENDLPYRSTRAGVMHACGHDGHTAILLGVARLLQENREAFGGTVKLLFQPAEELPPGGAQALIKAGALEGVDAVIGLHLMADMPLGRAGIRVGPMMAHSDRFTIEIEGRGGHGASPHQTVDAVVAAAQVVLNLQTLVSRRVNPLAPAVVTVGALHAGSTFNVIAPRAELKGTTRCFDDDVRDLLERELTRVSESTCAALGASCKVHFEQGYPAVVNDTRVTEVLRAAAAGVLGPDQVFEPPLTMGGEDFAYYQRVAPGAFLFLGAGNPDTGAGYPHHHPRFNIDERALTAGVRILADAALDLLGGTR